MAKWLVAQELNELGNPVTESAIAPDNQLVSFPDPNNPSEDRLQYLAGKEGLVN